MIAYHVTVFLPVNDQRKPGHRQSAIAQQARSPSDLQFEEAEACHKIKTTSPDGQEDDIASPLASNPP